jgi:hypothetical protein
LQKYIIALLKAATWESFTRYTIALLKAAIWMDLRRFMTALLKAAVYYCATESGNQLHYATESGHTNEFYSLHILELTGSKYDLCTKNTLVTDLQPFIDAVETGLEINGAIHKQQIGVISPSEMANLKENGGFITPVMLFLDAKSVCDAIESDNDNSADKSMIFHVKAFRHMFMTGQLASSTWLDTRDVLADGLTKGKIDRHALMKALNTRKWIVEHPSVTWKHPCSAQIELPWKDIPKPPQ